jgi:hypothetical protein
MTRLALILLLCVFGSNAYAQNFTRTLTNRIGKYQNITIDEKVYITDSVKSIKYLFMLRNAEYQQIQDYCSDLLVPNHAFA